MKKFFSILLLCLTCLAASAQNIQVHYDLGHSLYKNLSSRQDVTTTVEMFKPDRWGSTYLFIDLDYENDGVMGAYWEISREFSLTKNKQWAFHIEYNGGASTGKMDGTYYGNRFQHAVLAGGAWNWHSANFARTFSLQAMYKYYFKNSTTGAHAFNGFQTTAVWGVNFAHGLCTTSGFADLWYNPSVNGNLVFVSEPQFWFNFNAIKGWKDINLSLGSEVEISNNFVWNDLGRNNKLYAIPTLAAKWTF